MRKLSDREKEVYDFIAASIRENGYAPSVRDIRDALGFGSTSTVHMYVSRLNDMGLITKDGSKSRALRIDGPGAQETKTVPILGRVTAGQPILAEQTFEGTIGFSAESLGCRQENLFALRVKGESMIGAGILDGDVVVVDRRSYAENGEIVVALIDDEATVKRFFRENGGYRLQPENPSMAPIYAERVEILGKVVASLRTYQ